MAFWRTKASISLKRVKMEKSYYGAWRAYRNSPTLFRTVVSPTPYGLPFLEIGGLQLQLPLISGTGKAMDFSFCRYIYRANPNRSQLKILEKRERERIHELTFFGYPLLSKEQAKLRISNFLGTFIGQIGTKVHEKCWEQQPWTQLGSPEVFQGTHVQGALRGQLCDSTAFLFTFGGVVSSLHIRSVRKYQRYSSRSCIVEFMQAS